MATGAAALDVVVPQGMQPGQLIQAQAPDGTLVQATIPTSVRPGGTMRVEYTPAPPAASTDTSSGPVLQYSQRELLVLGVLVLAGLLLPFFTATVVTLLHALVCYVLPIGFAGLIIAYDWDLYGPTVAVKHGAMSAAVAWVIVVPLGFVTDSMLSSSMWLILYGGSLLLLLALSAAFGLCGCVGGLLLLLLCATFQDFMTDLITGPLGHTAIFLLVFMCTRIYMRLVLPQHTDPATWPYTLKVDNESEEFRSQADFFLASTVPWEHKYDFKLRVKNLYRIERPSTAEHRLPAAVATGSRRLFHGTQWEAAMGIVCDGFRLPSNAGMFGKGLYFADCPLKCWRYCFPSKQMSITLPRLTGRGGFVFMCWVDLGKVREEKEARPQLSGYNRNGWWAWLTRQRGAYDSVVGVTEEDGGALRVPEYIVYEPGQVRLAYLFEVVKAETESSAVNSNLQAQE
eukprot:TRINITY_DN77722_c0_g1_i1.p1 TRINITY_DN77722_c0_g1~~TRINITY_DN77722_c0_g1_i1.p1  ORF type:complete len:456 (+),score=82.62 TRINITY_DN77722_c0_g1_i1:44-1411(+)